MPSGKNAAEILARRLQQLCLEQLLRRATVAFGRLGVAVHDIDAALWYIELLDGAVDGNRIVARNGAVVSARRLLVVVELDQQHTHSVRSCRL